MFKLVGSLPRTPPHPSPSTAHPCPFSSKHRQSYRRHRLSLSHTVLFDFVLFLSRLVIKIFNAIINPVLNFLFIFIVLKLQNYRWSRNITSVRLIFQTTACYTQMPHREREREREREAGGLTRRFCWAGIKFVLLATGSPAVQCCVV